MFYVEGYFGDGREEVGEGGCEDVDEGVYGEEDVEEVPVVSVVVRRGCNC